MFLASISNTESSDLVIYLSGMVYGNYQEEESPRRCSESEDCTAQHRNNHAPEFGIQENWARFPSLLT